MTLDVNPKNCLEQRAISSRVQSQELSTELSGELRQADYRAVRLHPITDFELFLPSLSITHFSVPPSQVNTGPWQMAQLQLVETNRDEIY